MKLIPLRQRGSYRLTRVDQKFGELSIIMDADQPGWYLAECGLCGKSESVSEKLLE